MNTRVWDLTATPRRLFALLVLSTLLAACGGGGGDGGGGTPVTLNIVPNAVAGLDAVVRESESVSFDGSASTDPDGTIAAYAWSASGDAVITLEGADTATPSFTAPDVEADTDIELTLEVTDNKGKKNTDTLTVTIFHHVDGNAPPTPIAGPVGDATPGAMIMLDASASTDTDGTVTAYKWVQLSGDPVELLVDGPIASFQAPSDIASETVFLFRLFVTDSAGERNAIDVPVTVTPTGDQPPVANAGPPQTVNAGESVTLNGGGADNETATEALQLAWTQTSGTPTMSFDNAGIPAPTFTAPADLAAEAVFTFELTVTDSTQQTATASTTVTVKPLIAGNVLPVAIIEGPEGAVAENVEVVLDGGNSTDEDGSIVKYEWVQLDVTPETHVELQLLNDGKTVEFTTPRITAPTTLRFRLTVTDDQGAVRSAIADVEITDANLPPQAVINNGVDAMSVQDGALVDLDGIASIDDGTIESYSWSADNEAIKIAVNTLNSTLASFTAPALAGDYTITLTVTDDGGLTSSDTITVTVRENLPPVVNAGEDKTVNAGDPVALNGSGNDPEGRNLKEVRWTHLPNAGQTTITLEKSNTFEPTFTAPQVTAAEETFTFELRVTDDLDQIVTDTVNVKVRKPVAGNTRPVAVVVPTVNGSENAIITLDGRESHDNDPGDSIAGYAWTQTGLVAGEMPVVLDLDDPARPRFDAGRIPAAGKTLTFELVVADTHGDVSLPAVVTVNIFDTGPDLKPDDMVFEAVSNAELHVPTFSNMQTVTGIEAPIEAHLFAFGGHALHPTATFRVTSASGGPAVYFQHGVVNPGDRVQVGVTLTEFAESTTTYVVFGKNSSPVYESPWSVTAKLSGDQTPQFSVADITDLSPDEVRVSAVITPVPDSFNTATPISAEADDGFTVQILGETDDSPITILRTGEKFRVRVAAPGGDSFDRNAIAKVIAGGEETPFTVRVRSVDTTPEFDPASIPAQEGLEPETAVTTDIKVIGFDGELAASVSGESAQMQVSADDGATFGSVVTTANVHAGDVIRISARSPAFDPAGGEASRTVTLSVGTESRDFVISTRAEDLTPEFDPASIPAQEGLEPETAVTTDVKVVGFDGELAASVSGESAQMQVSADDGATFGSVVTTANVHAGDVIRISARSPAFDPAGGEASRTVTLSVGTESRDFIVSTRAENLIPEFNPASIPAQEGLEPETAVTTDVKVIGFDGELAAEVSGESAQMQLSEDNGVTFGPRVSATAVTSGDVIRLHGVSAPFDPAGASVTRTMTLRVSAETRDFVVTTRAPNRIPDDTFSIAEKTNAAVGLPVRSDVFTIPGIDVPVPVSVTSSDPALAAVLLKNGTQIVNGDTAGPADELTVELMTPDDVNANVSATVTAGFAELEQKSAVFEVTTASSDTTPAAFSFPPFSVAPLNTIIQSIPMSVSGLSSGATATVRVSGDEGAAYAVSRAGGSFGEYITGETEVSNGDAIRVHVLSASDFNHSRTVTLSVGPLSADYVVTTVADEVPPQVEITFPVNGAFFNAEEVETLAVVVKATDNDAVGTVFVNGEEAPIDTNAGQRVVHIPVVPGINTITVDAIDVNDNQAQQSIVIRGETGILADVRDMTWAGGKLYSIMYDAFGRSRLVITDVATGNRETRILDRHVGSLIPDNRINPTRLFMTTAGGDVAVYALDLLSGTGELRPISAATEEPRLNGNDRFAVLETADGPRLLAARRSSTDHDNQLIEISLTDGSREILYELTDNKQMQAFDIHGTNGWWVTNGVPRTVVRLNLEDLSNVNASIRTIATTALPETFVPTDMAIAGDVDEPQLYLMEQHQITRIAADGQTGALVTGREDLDTPVVGSGPRPTAGPTHYRGLAVDDVGQLYVQDALWSMLMRVDTATGNRTIVSGLNGGIEPSALSIVFPDEGDIGLFPDGSVFVTRAITQTIPYVEKVPSASWYDQENGRWSYLTGLRMTSDNSETVMNNIMPVSQDMFYASSAFGWENSDGSLAGPGIARMSRDTTTGHWNFDVFSIRGDGNLPADQTEDWNVLKAVARHAATGNFWGIDYKSDAGYRLWRVDGDNGRRRLHMAIPAAIDGVTISTNPAASHALEFVEDAAGTEHLLWYTEGEEVGDRLFEIVIDASTVTALSDFGNTPFPARGDICPDERLQLLYLMGEYNRSIDILDGTVIDRFEMPFPALDDGPTNGERRTVFDEQRRRLWVYSGQMLMVYLVQPDTGDVVMLPKH